MTFDLYEHEVLEGQGAVVGRLLAGGDVTQTHAAEALLAGQTGQRRLRVLRAFEICSDDRGKRLLETTSPWRRAEDTHPHGRSAPPSSSGSPAGPRSDAAPCTHVGGPLGLPAASEGSWMPERSVTAGPTVYGASWPRPVWGGQRRIAGLFRSSWLGGGGSDQSIYSLWTLRTKNGIKVLIELDPGRLVRELCHVSVELGEDLVIKSHHLLHGLLSDGERGLLKPCYCGGGGDRSLRSGSYWLLTHTPGDTHLLTHTHNW